MEIVVAQPPNFDAIVAVFPFAKNVGVIFTYGQTIYNPSAVKVSAALRCHESVHAQRQGNEPDGWWASYLNDSQFRLEEELIAHRAEYRAFRSWSKIETLLQESLK